MSDGWRQIDLGDKTPLEVLRTPRPPSTTPQHHAIEPEADSIFVLACRLLSLGCTNEAVLAGCQMWAAQHTTISEDEVVACVDGPVLSKYGGKTRSNTNSKATIRILADELAKLGFNEAGVLGVLQIEAPKMVNWSASSHPFERSPYGPAWLAEVAAEVTKPAAPQPPPPVVIPSPRNGKMPTARGSLHSDPNFLLRLRVRLEDAARYKWNPLDVVVETLREHVATQADLAARLLSETRQVVIYQGAQNVYKIHMLHDEREAVVELNQEDLVSGPKPFVEKYLQHFHEVLHFNTKSDDWKLLIEGWLDPTRVVIQEGREDADEETLAYESVLGKIQTLRLIDDLAASVRNERHAYWHEPTGRVWLSSEKLEAFLRASNQAVPIKRIAQLLREQRVALDTSFPRGVVVQQADAAKGLREKRRNVRFWSLDPDAFGWTRQDVEHYSEDETVPPMPENDTEAGAGEGPNPR